MPEAMIEPGWIEATWPAPPWIRAGGTTRLGGVSPAPYDSLNLGEHVGDDPDCVRRNRQRLRKMLGLDSEPTWLAQQHGNRVIAAHAAERIAAADAAFTTEIGVACVVLTADCLPLLLCNSRGTQVAAAHVGWRGLVSGVITNIVRTFTDRPDELLVWLGPGIGPLAYEVGSEVRKACCSHAPGTERAFQPAGNGRWLADLGLLVRLDLDRLGVGRCYGGHWCTASAPELFYSYRRDGRTGRMASLIWLEHREC
jgi:YfiH family protein